MEDVVKVVWMKVISVLGTGDDVLVCKYLEEVLHAVDTSLISGSSIVVAHFCHQLLIRCRLFLIEELFKYFLVCLVWQ